ncbi:MAG: trypsin-like peptidase domain-containing protein [Planctomycetota bacterium]
MIHIQRVPISAVLVSVMVLSGCGGATGDPSVNGGAESAHAAHPNVRLDKAVKMATLHLKYKEYDQAEKALQAALAEPGVTDTEKAIALLDFIKSEKKANEIPPAAATAAHSPLPSPASPPVAAAVPPKVGEARVGEASVTANSVAGEKPVAPVEQPAAKPTAGPNAADEKPANVIIVEDAARQETPVEKVAATDAMVTKLEETARTEYEAVAALKLYERFVERHTLTPEQEKKLAPRLEKWREQAGRGLVRNGTLWIAPEIAKKNAEQADKLIEQAATLIKLNNVKEVRDVLEKASRLDANGIQADFILGLLNSGVGVNHPATAEEHFKRVLVRSPRHISALNNLALTEIKLGKFQQALNHFTQAREQAPRTPEVNQNIGRLIKESSAKRIDVPDGLQTRFSKLYAELTVSGKVQPSNPNRGWLYMPMYLSENERKGRKTAEGGNGGDLVLCGSGTGFVVHPGYVLTNRHVVRDDEFGVVEGLKIVDPTDEKHERELPAKVVAISADHDVALVKCDAIKAPAISLSTSVPRRGTEILALGYPKSNLIGRGLKATRGIVTSLPEAATDNMLMFDAEINGGNSGGPVLNKTGEAIAVATARYNVAIVGNYSAGIPSTLAIPFVKNVLPDFASQPAAVVEKSWPDIDAQVGPSTVMLLCYHRSVSVGLNKAATASAATGPRTVLEDVTCSVCNGAGKRRCTNKGCVKGAVSTKEAVQAEVGTIIKKTVTQYRFVNSPCPVCSGTAQVDCGTCSSGRDLSLRGQ